MQKYVGFLLLFCFKVAWAVTIDATLDRKVVQENESFTLTFSIIGESLEGEPDLTPLKRNFDIISQQRSQNISVINGKTDRETRWVIQLMSKTSGSLIIPQIQFGHSISPELYIQVNPTIQNATFTGNEDIFLETKLDKPTGYIGEQFILTIRFYRAVDLRSGELTEPDIAQQDATIERLEQDRTFETKQYNQPYIVTERKYAIFPKKSGKITIPSVVFTGDIMKGRVSVFDAFSSNIQRRKISATPLTLTVLPKPEAYKGNWLPASDLMLTQSWSPEASEVDMGTPVTRTIQIEASGVMLNQLPQIASDYPSSFKVYIDQGSPVELKTEAGFTSQKQYKIVLMAIKPGQYHLPEVRVPWWDTTNKVIKWAEVAGRDIEVVAVATNEPASSLPPSSTQIISTGKTAEASIWKWSTLALGVLWLGTLCCGWVFYRRKGIASHSKKAESQDEISLKQAIYQIKQAALKNDAKLCAIPLLRWAQLSWPDKIIHAIGDIHQYVSSPLTEEMIKLNHILYGKQQIWDGQTFWRAFKEFQPEKRKSFKSDSLPPLYD